ncbi:hypothetical protein BD770DRAFT_328092, partial [Pilaira anomala]
FQETRARSPEIIHSLNIHFQPQCSHWTKHVGIVSLSPNYQVTIINTDHVYANDRFQLCRIDHPQQFYESFYVLNIYAPANNDQIRKDFFGKLTNMLYDQHDTINFNRLIISGDFNYSLLRNRRLTSSTSSDWLALLDTYFYNTMQMNDFTEIPTFQRTNNGSMIASVIDYIYVGQLLYTQLKDTNISRLNAAWSDHSILDITFVAGTSPTGPGLWRANPTYANHRALQLLITKKIFNLMKYFQKVDTILTPAEKWDRVKASTKKVIKIMVMSMSNGGRRQLNN